MNKILFTFKEGMEHIAKAPLSQEEKEACVKKLMALHRNYEVFFEGQDLSLEDLGDFIYDVMGEMDKCPFDAALATNIEAWEQQLEEQKAMDNNQNVENHGVIAFFCDDYEIDGPSADEGEEEFVIMRWDEAPHGTITFYSDQNMGYGCHYIYTLDDVSSIIEISKKIKYHDIHIHEVLEKKYGIPFWDLNWKEYKPCVNTEALLKAIAKAEGIDMEENTMNTINTAAINNQNEEETIMTNQTANQNTAVQNVNIKEESTMSTNTTINIAVISEVNSLTAKQIEMLNKSVNALLGIYEAQGSYLIFAGNKAGSKIAAAKIETKVPHANIGVGQEKGQRQFKYVVSAAGDSPCRKAISKAHLVIVLGGKQMGELSARTAKLANNQHKDCYGILADGNTISQVYEGNEDIVIEPVFGETVETKAEAPKTETEKVEITAQYMAEKLSMTGKKKAPRLDCSDEGIEIGFKAEEEEPAAKKAEKQPEAIVKTKAEEALNSSLEYVKSQEVLDTSKMEKALDAKKAELAAARATVAKLDKEVENMEKELKAAKEAAAAVNRKNALKKEVLEKAIAMLREIDLGRVSSIEEAAEKLKTIGSRDNEVAKDMKKEGKKEETNKEESVTEEKTIDTTGDVLHFQGANYEVLVNNFDISLAKDPAKELSDAVADGRVRLDNFKAANGHRYVVNGSFDYAAYQAATKKDKQRMMQAALDSGNISRVEKEVKAA
jgi:hypothetical protein